MEYSQFKHEPTPPTNAPDHRRAARRRSEQEIVIEVVRAGHIEAPVAVAMRDFSPRGIGFLFTGELDLGSQFILTLIQPGGTPSHLLYNVTRCRKVGGGIFHVGAEFLCVVSDRSTIRRSA